MKYVVFYLEPSYFDITPDGLVLKKSVFYNLVEYKKFCTHLAKSDKTFITFSGEHTPSGTALTTKLLNKVINYLEV